MDMEKREDYRGFTMVWEEPPLMGGMRSVFLGSKKPHLARLLGPSFGKVFSGKDLEDAKSQIRDYVDQLLPIPR